MAFWHRSFRARRRPAKRAKSMAFESTLADVPARRACKTILSFAASPHCNRSVPALPQRISLTDCRVRTSIRYLLTSQSIFGVTNFYWRERMKRILLAALITSFAVGSALAQSCETKAVGKDGKPLSGAAKTSFVKKCKQDACETKA